MRTLVAFALAFTLLACDDDADEPAHEHGPDAHVPDAHVPAASRLERPPMLPRPPSNGLSSDLRPPR